MYKRLIDRTTTVELEVKKIKNKSKILFKAYNKYFNYTDKTIIETQFLKRFIDKIKNIRNVIDTKENKGIYYDYDKYEIYLSKIDIDIDNSISMYIDFSINISDRGADRYIICLSYYELLDILKYIECEIDKIEKI